MSGGSLYPRAPAWDLRSIGSVSALIRFTLSAFLTTGSTVLRPRTELVVRTFLTDSITALGGGILARVQTCCCWSHGADPCRCQQECIRAGT